MCSSDLGEWITLGHELETTPGQHGETPSLLKIRKISWAWWRVPKIPATQEAEGGELPEPGGGGCGELRWHHCTLAWVTRAKLCLKKKKKRNLCFLQVLHVHICFLEMLGPFYVESRLL